MKLFQGRDMNFDVVVNECCTTTILSLIRHLLFVTFHKKLYDSSPQPQHSPNLALQNSDPPSRDEVLTQLSYREVRD